MEYITKAIEKGESSEVRYFINNLKIDVELFSRAVRGHWATESMYWSIDIEKAFVLAN